jgi:uncharacterized membrane protein
MVDQRTLGWDVLWTLGRDVLWDVPAVGVGVVTAWIAVILPPGSSLRMALAVPILVFLPGYALTVAVFPRSRPQQGNGDNWHEPQILNPATKSRKRAGLSTFERVAASFGLTVALVPLVGLVLAALGLGIGVFSTLIALSVLTVGLVIVGTVRRVKLAPAERYDIPADRWLRQLGGSISGASESPSRGLLVNAVLLVSLLVVVVSFGTAALAPGDGTSFTEFALLTEEADGDYVAADYPTSLEPGEQASLVFSVKNKEDEETEYSVVAYLRPPLDANATEGTLSPDATRLATFQRTVADDEIWYETHTFSLTADQAGSDLRLTYLLYRGDPPTNPTPENAYRTTQITVDVESG